MKRKKKKKERSERKEKKMNDEMLYQKILRGGK